MKCYRTNGLALTDPSSSSWLDVSSAEIRLDTGPRLLLSSPVAAGRVGAVETVTERPAVAGSKLGAFGRLRL